METKTIKKDDSMLEVEQNETGKFDWVLTSQDGLVDCGTCDSLEEALEMINE